MNLKLSRIVGLALLSLCAACSRPVASDSGPSNSGPSNSGPSDSPQSIPPASAPVIPVSAVAMPVDQANLLKLIATVNANSKDGAVFNHFCDSFEKTPSFTGWTGTVADVQTSTVDGAIDITFRMGKHLSFEPVVQKTDPVYPAVSALTVGDAVTLSGKFSHNKGSSECNYYLGSFAVSLTKVAAGAGPQG